MMFVRILALAALCLAVLPARADEAQIRKVIEAKLDGARIESVQPMPVLGLYEVVIRGEDGPRIVYTDAQATSIILGSIYDVRHDRNLTDERMNKLLAIKFNSTCRCKMRSRSAAAAGAACWRCSPTRTVPRASNSRRSWRGSTTSRYTFSCIR